MKRRKAYNDRGFPIGETHHRARISDLLVKTLRDAHEYDGVGLRKLAHLYGLKLSTVQKICAYTRRTDIPASFKEVEDTEEDQE